MGRVAVDHVTALNILRLAYDLRAARPTSNFLGDWQIKIVIAEHASNMMRADKVAQRLWNIGKPGRHGPPIALRASLGGEFPPDQGGAVFRNAHETRISAHRRAYIGRHCAIMRPPALAVFSSDLQDGNDSEKIGFEAHCREGAYLSLEQLMAST